MSDFKVNKELTSSFLLNWRNQRRKRFNYWLNLGVKIACLVHACLNSTNDFWKSEKAWKMMIALDVHAQFYRWQHWKSARCYLKDRRFCVGAVAEEVSWERETFRRILKEELNMRIVCAKIVTKVLSDVQKERRKELCLDLWNAKRKNQICWIP